MPGLNPKVLQDLYGPGYGAEPEVVINPLPGVKGITPDTAGKALQISSTKGIDALVAAKQLPQLQDELDQDQWDAFVKDHPISARNLSNNLVLAAAARDDLPQIGAIERGLKALGSGAVQATLGLSEGIWRTPDAIARVSTAAQRVLPGVIGPQIIADTFGLIAKATNPLADKISEAQKLLAEDTDSFGDSFKRINIKGQQADAALSQAMGGNLQGLGNVLTDPEAWAGFIGNAVPSLVSAWKSGGSVPFLAWMEGMQTAQNAAEFEKKTGHKIDPADFTQAMAQAATLNAWLERFGLDKVMGAKGGGLTGVLKATLSEGGTEGLQQFNSNLAQLAAYNQDQNLGEGVLGSIMGGAGTGAGASTAMALSEVATRAQDHQDTAAKAQATADALAELGAMAEQSKLLQRAPEEFTRLVQQFTQDGVQSVFVDARTLADTLAQSAKPISSPAIEEQMQQAIEAGGNVELPIGEFTQLIAQPELRGLADHAKLDPYAPSAAEAKLWQEQHAAQFDQEVASTMQQQLQDRQKGAQAQAVYENVLAQLEATGRHSRTVNRAYANLQRYFYATMAQRAGMTEEAFAAAYPLRIQAQGQGAYNQDQTKQEPFRQWFADGNVTDDQGQPLKVYHATSKSFDAFDPAQIGQGGANAAPNKLPEEGFFFTPSLDEAHEFIDNKREGSNIMPVYLAGNYKVLDYRAAHPWTGGLYDNAVVALEIEGAKKQGYDGLRIDGMMEPSYFGDNPPPQFVAFHPEKIKSAIGNRGTFDGNSPNVLHQGEDARGSFDPVTSTIALLKNADLSTFLHESGHFWLETLASVAGSQDAPPQIREDMQQVLDWFGVKDLATWQGLTLDEKRQHHEKFARGVEAYLFEGKAPSLELQGIFSRFRAWLINVYKSLKALDVELTDEVRGVFDRMLASDQQLAEAAQARNAQPLFTTKPPAMSEGEWLAYQSMAEDTVQGAITSYHAKRLKDLAARRTKAGAKAYRAILEGVKTELKLRPIYAVQEYLRNGTLPDGTQAGDPVKLSIPAMKEIYGEGPEALWRQLSFGHKGLASGTGVHPDIVAENFGFSSGDAMVRAILEAPKLSDLVKAEASKRFAEEHGNAFTPEEVRQAAEAELDNEHRAQQLVAELNVLRRGSGQDPVIYKAAKDYAERAVSNMTVKRARSATTHASAEARASRAAAEAYKAGDTAKAAQAKRDQVLNNQLARASRNAREEIQAAIDRTRPYFKPDSQLGKLRDMDLVNAARAILASHGLGNSDKTAGEYLASVKKNDPDTWAEIEPMVQDALLNPMDYRKMTLEAFRGMIDSVETIWHLSRRTRQIEIDGQLMERAEVTSALVQRIQALGPKHGRVGYDKAITNWQETKFGLLGWRAALRRVEPWVSQMDGSNPAGVFRKFVWQPISESVGQYRAAKAELLQRYLELVKNVKISRGEIEAPELGYKFKDKAELLHAILHTGNESNLSKLLRGREWGKYQEDGTVDASNWRKFIARAAREGIVSKADYDFAQGIWDMLESTKPAAQKAHRDMYGFYFHEVEATPVQTPFGTYRGGYVPAVTDPRIVTDAAINREAENSMGNNAFMFPSTGRGFTKGRVEGYAKPLLLDLSYLPAHLDKVLRFSYVEPRIKDVARIVKSSRGFGEAMDSLDPAARTDLLIPWLQRTAAQRVETPSTGRGGRAADRFFHALRKRTGLQVMTANVVNTLQQVTGLSSAALKVKPRYLRNALWGYVKQPKVTAQAISEKSTFMAHRVTAQAMEIQQHIDELLVDPNKYEQAKAFAEKHGYFLQSGFQNVVDVITWSGAYEQAVEGGATELEAVRMADSAVRETQGSFAPEDVSRFETGSPFMRAFTMFYSYFNTQANLVGTEFANTARDMGLRQGAGRMFYIYLFGVMIPATLAEVIVRAAGGGDGFDDDQDGDVDLWDAFAIFFGSQGRFLAGMVPGAGPALMAGINAWNDKWYDDRISTSPAVSTIESSVRAPHSIYKAMAEDGSTKRAIRDTLTALGMVTGLPLAPLAKPLGYMADVEEGKTNPEGAVDMARGLVTGR